MGIILGLSGRTQCGKTTAAEYIARQLFLERGLKYPDVQILYFGAKLKSLLKELFGLTDFQLYDDKGKNIPTHLRWENMPGVITPEQARSLLGFTGNESLQQHFDSHAPGILVHEPGFMTGREVMEYVGTPVFRRMYEDVWVNYVINYISTASAQYFIIGDVRSPNEVEKIQCAGGYVARFTRNIENRQTQIEKLLDPEVYDWKIFDYIIDNVNMDVGQKNKSAYNYLLGLSGPRLPEVETDFKSNPAEVAADELVDRPKKDDTKPVKKK